MSPDSGVHRLTDALNCTGPGVYNVSVQGRLEIEQKIHISDQKNVTIIGFVDDDFKSASNPSGYTVISFWADGQHILGVKRFYARHHPLDARGSVFRRGGGSCCDVVKRLACVGLRFREQRGFFYRRG